VRRWGRRESNIKTSNAVMAAWPAVWVVIALEQQQGVDAVGPCCRPRFILEQPTHGTPRGPTVSPMNQTKKPANDYASTQNAFVIQRMQKVEEVSLLSTKKKRIHMLTIL